MKYLIFLPITLLSFGVAFGGQDDHNDDLFGSTANTGKGAALESKGGGNVEHFGITDGSTDGGGGDELDPKKSGFGV